MSKVSIIFSELMVHKGFGPNGFCLNRPLHDEYHGLLWMSLTFY